MNMLENSATKHRIKCRVTDDVVFLVPEGAGDQSCAEDLEKAIDALSRDGHRKFVLDLAHLNYFESTGFRLIVNKVCELQNVGGSLVVRGLHGAIARAFKLLKLEGFVPVVEETP